MTSRILLSMVCTACLISVPAGAQETEAPDQQPTLRFEGYPGARDFEVVPRKDKLFFYPCTQCHRFLEPNPEVRELAAPHDIKLEHGRGRIWCLSCHSLENRDNLRTLLDEPVDFDDAYLVCGGCHANRQQDWYFGVHGKRLANWQGERKLYNCTECHDAHSPAIKPRKPKPPPPVRAGLERVPGAEYEQHPVWETLEEQEDQ